MQHPSKAAEHILLLFVFAHLYSKGGPGHCEKWDFSQLRRKIIFVHLYLLLYLQSVGNIVEVVKH